MNPWAIFLIFTVGYVLGHQFGDFVSWFFAGCMTTVITEKVENMIGRWRARNVSKEEGSGPPAP